jgi:biotin transport system substrate-specific component
MTETSTLPRSKNKTFTTKELVLTALMSVFIAIGSWISIPTEIPFTMQTFAVFSALFLLGGKKGFFSVLVFILLGAAGIPVFQGFTGGIGILFGMTGGYIIGFLGIAAIYWLAELIPLKNKAAVFVRNIIAMVIGLAVCYAFGTAWFMHVYAKQVESISLTGALKMCVTPFVIVDLIKLAAAALYTYPIKKYAKI